MDTPSDSVWVDGDIPGPRRSLHAAAPTQWFVVAAKDDLVTGTAEVWTPAAGGRFGRIHAERRKRIAYLHVHVDVAFGGSNTLDLELWRNRDQPFGFGAGNGYGEMTLIATLSVPVGLNDGASGSFAFLSEELRRLEPGDYIHIQPVNQKPSGNGWHVFCDGHYDEDYI